MRLYRHVWFKHLCQIVSIVFLACTVLTGCNDDGPNPDHDDEIEAPLPEPLPTEDIIETRVNALTAIYADNPDEMTALFLNRLESGKIEPEISSETELIIFDEAGASKFINNSELFDKLKDLYQRGALIYFHKPAIQASALMARLELGVFEEVPDEIIPPICDAFILNIQGAEYMVNDIHTSGSQEHISIDEEGNEAIDIDEIVEAPSEYIYGRYAENAAKFANEALDVSLRSRPTVVQTRGGEKMSEPPLIPMHWDKSFNLYKQYKKKDNHMAETVTLEAKGTVHITAKIRCAYSFDSNKDYYQITLSENYPGGFFWKGENKIKYKAAYDDKYGGFALEAMRVTASLDNFRDESVKVSVTEGIAPNNHPANGSKETITGWSLGGSVGVSYPWGVAANFSGGYTSTTSISMPYSEIPATFERDQSNNTQLKWSYNVNNPLRYHKHRGRNGGVNKYPKISTQDVTFEQTWSWVIDNALLQEEQDLNLNVLAVFTITSGAATSGAGANHSYNFGCDYPVRKTIALPKPERYKERVTVVASPVNATSSYLRKLMAENSPSFRYLQDNPERAGVTSKNLRRRLSNEWNQVYNELNRLGAFSGVDEEVTFYLQTDKGERLTIGSTNFKGIRFRKNGKVSLYI